MSTFSWCWLNCLALRSSYGQVLAREAGRLECDHLSADPDAKWPLLTLARLKEAQVMLLYLSISQCCCCLRAVSMASVNIGHLPLAAFKPPCCKCSGLQTHLQHLQTTALLSSSSLSSFCTMVSTPASVVLIPPKPVCFFVATGAAGAVWGPQPGRGGVRGAGHLRASHGVRSHASRLLQGCTRGSRVCGGICAWHCVTCSGVPCGFSHVTQCHTAVV